MIARVLLIALIAFSSTSLPSMAEADLAESASSVETRAAAFIEGLSGTALSSLTDPTIDRRQRVQNFRTLFEQNFAAGAIGKWVLGRYWRMATPEQRREYLDLFSDLIVVSYVDRFAEYTGNGLVVSKTLVSDDQSIATVFSNIKTPGNGNPVRVDWRLGAKGDTFKILDVVIEGVSLSQTFRSDFASTINRGGGDVEALLVMLRERTASLRKGLAG